MKAKALNMFELKRLEDVSDWTSVTNVLWIRVKHEKEWTRPSVQEMRSTTYLATPARVGIN